MRLSLDTAYIVEINPGARPGPARGAEKNLSLAERAGIAGLAARRQTAQETITIIDGSIPTEGVPTSRSIRQTQSGSGRLNPLARRFDHNGCPDAIGVLAASHEIIERTRKQTTIVRRSWRQDVACAVGGPDGGIEGAHRDEARGDSLRRARMPNVRSAGPHPGVAPPT